MLLRDLVQRQAIVKLTGPEVFHYLAQVEAASSLYQLAKSRYERNKPLLNNDMLAQHPLWQLLSLQKQQQLLIIQSQQAGNNDPWAVSLTAKNTADNQVDDQQLGIAVSVPLTLGSALSQTELSQWQQANTEHTLNLDRTYIELKTQLKKLEQQQQNLLDQQTLLTRYIRPIHLVEFNDPRHWRAYH